MQLQSTMRACARVRVDMYVNVRVCMPMSMYMGMRICIFQGQEDGILMSQLGRIFEVRERERVAPGTAASSTHMKLALRRLRETNSSDLREHADIVFM